MKQDEFMCEYFKDGTTVTVDANELQKRIRDKRALTAKVKDLKYKLELRDMVKPMHIDLKA